MKRNLEIGKRIKGLRETRGLSKSALARLSGVTTTCVWNWEENGTTPRFETFGRVAQALDTSETYLRTGTESEVARAQDVNGSSSSRTVAVIIEDARNEIASITGIALSKVRLNVEFVSN